MPPFADHFSGVAASYAAFRPSYPKKLIEFLAGLAPGRDLAWDCGTGSGQAAVLLADRFTTVVATDASREQIAHARGHPGVTYRVALEDDSGLADGSADLVTVAQALHWLDLGRFYGEVHRVLRPRGILAAWTYTSVRLPADLGRIVDAFYADRVGRYWPPQRRQVETGYREMEFPFEEIPTGDWSIPARIDRATLLGYVGTWSAVKECRAREGVDPIAELEADLLPHWPDAAEQVEARWPLAVRAGRLPDRGSS
jgi:SAM-dependent methyltransferase